MKRDIEEESVDISGRWLVVLACFIGIVIAGGIAFTCSIYYVEWLDTFGGSYATTAIIASLNMGILAISGPISSLLSNLIGFRWTIFIGGLMSFCGLVGSVFASNMYVLMGTFGVITGMGFGLTAVPFSVAPAAYYRDNQALVTGLGLSGLGFGSFVMPLIIEYTLELYFWRGSMLILAGISLNICIVGALIPPKQPSLNVPMKPEPGQEMPTAETMILRSKPMWLFMVHGTLFSMGISVMFVHITAFVEYQTHVTKYMASMLLMGYGVAVFVGRIGHGLIAQIKYVHIQTQHLIGYALAGFCILLMTSTTSYPAMVFLACSVAFCSACYASLSTPILSEIIGHHKLTSGYGYLNLAFGLGLVSGAPIAGRIYDASRNYHYSMYFSGFVILLSVFVMIPVCMKSLNLHRKPALPLRVMLEQQHESGEAFTKILNANHHNCD
ncbi:monocarboxylate transporter 12-like [Tubulanus polymorphus]|uniref:monocarboxylate transporter 12-like n=1 Tax=Tubulanus polymorphus TaxID=672921 RepID=UPI003DA47115